jgi:hypothetical protein
MMTMNEKTACLFADIWAMFVECCDFDSFDLQNIIAKHGLGQGHIVTEDEKDNFRDADVGDEVLVLSIDGKLAMEVAKQCSMIKK